MVLLVLAKFKFGDLKYLLIRFEKLIGEVHPLVLTYIYISLCVHCMFATKIKMIFILTAKLGA